MASANAVLEKLKYAGLRHGEKAGVAIASGLFFLCIVLAAKKETLATTPDEIKAATKQSSSNLNRHEEPEKIIKNLEEKGIKNSNFAKVVEDQVKTALVPADYKAAREWVSPEPGAGLIRDTPVLIAPSDLYAYPGRGGFLVFALDSEGNRIPDDGKDAPKDEPTRRRRKRAAGGMMGGGMMGGGMMGGAPRQKKGRSAADIAAERKAEAERTGKLLAKKLAGKDSDAPEEKNKEEAAENQEQFKEVTKGHRWVAITGVLDHAQLVANYRTALKNPATAHPNYARLDLERKTQLPDGTWSSWEPVSSKHNLDILDNLPEVEEDELAPETVRPAALVDPLPFLKSGLWEGVHVARLVPKEKKEVSKQDLNERGAGMMGGGMMGGGMGGGKGGMGAMMQMQQSQANMMSQMMGGDRGGMGRRGGGLGMGLGGGGMGTTETAVNYWKTDEKNVMIRAFDFTVQPDTSYRYRARVVVYNPNLNHDDVSPGVDTKSKTMRGPWSEATDEVHMPADVMPYAVGSDQATRSADMKIRFQVIRFRPADGVTVTKNVMAGPGELIGEPGVATIPSSDGTKPKSTNIDFNSHQLVLDLIGNKKTNGYQALPTGFVGPPIERPTVTLLLRPDGSVAVHNEADDLINEVRRDIDANYKHEIKESGKKRERSTGVGMMGMGMMGGMGGMGGMRGGGMGSGMR
jgi:hypothetical protein